MKKMSDEEFIRVWQRSESRQDVADACQTDGNRVSIRAQKLREMGVNLKFFARGRPRKKVDVEKLNALINELT